MSTLTASSFAALVGLTMLAACGPPLLAEPNPPLIPPEDARDPALGPETDEERVDAALYELGEFCMENPESCRAIGQPEVYPDVDVSEADRRYVDDREEEVRSLGVRVRWDPGTDRFEVERGNTPIRGGELRDDP